MSIHRIIKNCLSSCFVMIHFTFKLKTIFMTIFKITFIEFYLYHDIFMLLDKQVYTDNHKYLKLSQLQCLKFRHLKKTYHTIVVFIIQIQHSLSHYKCIHNTHIISCRIINIFLFYYIHNNSGAQAIFFKTTLHIDPILYLLYHKTLK